MISHKGRHLRACKDITFFSFAPQNKFVCMTYKLIENESVIACEASFFLFNGGLVLLLEVKGLRTFF